MLSIWISPEICCLVLELILHNVASRFNDLEKKAFENMEGKKRKCWQPAFSPLSTVFSTLSKTIFFIRDISKLLSVNALI